MVTFPNAKINLGLNIISKRNDGYHNISSCFYPLPFTDILEIAESNKTSFTTTGLPIPGNGDAANLCVKAYELLAGQFNLPPVSIHLHKIIPIGAGLGGGSSNASFTLKTLDQLFNLKLPAEQLEGYAAKLGSDCPFFINNQPVLATGTGTTFTTTGVSLKGKWCLLLHPSIHIGTAEAYATITPKAPEHPISAIIQQPMEKWKKELVNDFQNGLNKLHPVINKMVLELYEQGAFYASLTGSGSAVYGLFNEETDIPHSLEKYMVWNGVLN